MGISDLGETSYTTDQFENDAKKICSFIGRDMEDIDENELKSFSLFGVTVYRIYVSSLINGICDTVTWSKVDYSQNDLKRYLKILTDFYGEYDNSGPTYYGWKNINDLTAVALQFGKEDIRVVFQNSEISKKGHSKGKDVATDDEDTKKKQNTKK